VRTRNIVVAGAATLLVAGGSVGASAFAATQRTGTRLEAAPAAMPTAAAAAAPKMAKFCVGKNGTVRYVPAHTRKCSQGRRLIVISTTGARGPAGARGPTGPTGTAGGSVVVATQTGTLATGPTTTVTCPATNQRAIAGGFVKDAADAAVDLVGSAQDPANPRVWIFTFAGAGITVVTGTTAQATCASVGAPATG
jgi:hypothetical protein